MKKILLILCISIIFCGCSNKDKTQKEIISETNEYEVVSVNQYVKNYTNKFGNIIDTKIYYTFTYVDKNNLVQINEFENFMNMHIKLGNTNKYVIKNLHNGHSETLYLTKETMNNLKMR